MNMRKIIGAAHLSLDGVMQGPGGADEDTSGGFDLGGWSMKYSDRKTGGAAILSLVGTLAKPHDLLLGRKTYDIFAGYWPNVPSDNRIGPVFTKANKYVVTAGAARLFWANSHRLRSIDDIKKIKSGDGADIVIWGSSTLYPQLLEADLIDRLVLLTYPIALGKGKRLFGNTTHPVSMKLVNSEVTATGVIIATYDQAG
jgi:dihydrofolate reductase